MKEIYKEIFLIENFLDELEHNSLLEIIEKSDEKLWHGVNINRIKEKYKNDPDLSEYMVEKRNDFWDDKILKINDEILWKSLTEKINKFFDYKYDINPVYAIQRQQPGTNLRVHFDQGDNPDLIKAVIIYLNDDYNGGELFFPDYNFEIKPPSKSMIMFPGTENYMHGVKEVLPGSTRYVLPSFGFKKEGSNESY